MREKRTVSWENTICDTFATMALEHGMDVKTLSATIGHVSSATTLDIYSHITDTMQRQAAVHIDRKIGGTDARMPTEKREERKRYRPGRIHAVQAQSTGSRDGLCHHD